MRLGQSGLSQPLQSRMRGDFAFGVLPFALDPDFARWASLDTESRDVGSAESLPLAIALLRPDSVAAAGPADGQRAAWAEADHEAR